MARPLRPKGQGIFRAASFRFPEFGDNLVFVESVPLICLKPDWVQEREIPVTELS